MNKFTGQISGIYKIICINNKFYIGSSNNIDKRLKEHINPLRRNKHDNKYLQQAWNEYGEQNFRYEIVETIYDISQLLIREKWWIDNSGCLDRKIGFNISSKPSCPSIVRFKDLTGQRFGRLVAIEYVGKNKWGNYLWECVCDCGKETVVDGCSLTKGSTKSCGCLSIEKAIQRNKNRFIDLTGQKFNRLTPTKYIGGSKWLCSCDCGKEKTISSASIKTGKTKSCGCLSGELSAKRNFKHGHHKTGKVSRTYSLWSSMIQRCNNKNHRFYKYYGGRTPPITVCRRWSNKKNGFQNFLKDMGECPTGKSLDRINNGDYCKENCKWSTSKEQSRNMGNNHLLKYNGKELCFSEWEELTGIPQATIRTRVKRGWSIKRTLTTPVNYRKTK